MTQAPFESELLSPLALSILELLDERPMHPYEMASTMRARHHDEFIRLNFGTLYHSVEVLERNGWILPSEREKEGKRPERTIYKLTESGREVLTTTLGELLRQPRKEYPHFAAGLMFMHHLTAKQAAAHLHERAEMLDVTIIAMLDAERTWVLGLEREIDEGKLEWKGIDSGHEALRRNHGERAH